MKLIIIIFLLIMVEASQAEFTAILEQEWAIDSQGHGQKFEFVFEPEWNVEVSDNLSMIIIARAQWDGANQLGSRSNRQDNYSTVNGAFVSDTNADIAIREWYFDTEYFGAFWRLGKQQVVWGQADGLKVLDVINPQNFREFILDDFQRSRIPLWMLNVEIPISDESSFQVIWIPDTTYNEFAQNGSRYEITSQLFVPQLPADINLLGFNQQKPSSVFTDSDLGLRYSTFKSGWDLTINYLYHYLDSPVLYQNSLADGVFINSRYERNHLFGATASNAFGDFTVRVEMGYSTDSYHLSSNLNQSGIKSSADISSVIGLDWMGLPDTMLSVQWFTSHLFDYDDAVIRPQDNNIFSFLYNRSFKNEIWDIEILALHGLDKDDGSLQAKINYLQSSNIKFWLGTDIFYGNKEGLLGQFKNQDRFTIGIQWGI